MKVKFWKKKKKCCSCRFDLGILQESHSHSWQKTEHSSVIAKYTHTHISLQMNVCSFYFWNTFQSPGKKHYVSEKLKPAQTATLRIIKETLWRGHCNKLVLTDLSKVLTLSAGQCAFKCSHILLLWVTKTSSSSLTEFTKHDLEIFCKCTIILRRPSIYVFSLKSLIHTLILKILSAKLSKGNLSYILENWLQECYKSLELYKQIFCDDAEVHPLTLH